MLRTLRSLLVSLWWLLRRERCQYAFHKGAGFGEGVKRRGLPGADVLNASVHVLGREGGPLA